MCRAPSVCSEEWDASWDRNLEFAMELCEGELWKGNGGAVLA